MAPKKRAVARKKKPEPPKQHAKNLSLLVSVGSEDRDRNIEDFLTAVVNALKNGAVKANHVTVAGAYYVLDGKTYLPKDYDPETQNAKPGATPPPWAGGPSISTLKEVAKGPEKPPRTPTEMLADLRANTAYGERYKKAQERLSRREENLEEFDWDMQDAEDSAKLEAHAEKSTKRAIKKMKSTPKKVVRRTKVAEAPKPSRRVVRRKK